MKIFKRPITAKFAVLLLVAFAVLAGGAYVIAQLVTDTYSDDSKIALSWNISTSTSGQIQLKDKYCDPNFWFCSESTTCANAMGDGDYVIPYYLDAPETKKWKTTNTWCTSPQCLTGGLLTYDNTISFTAYPARDYCKSIGGRLPTLSELQCIYTNRANFGTFNTGYYWSASERAETSAYYVDFSSGSASFSSKGNAYSVRCVRGW